MLMKKYVYKISPGPCKLLYLTFAKTAEAAAWSSAADLMYVMKAFDRHLPSV